MSRLIYPQETAVSPDCDAIATTGSATYKYTWLVEKSGKSVMIGTHGHALGRGSSIARDSAC